MEIKPQRTPEREAYYARANKAHLAPLWEKLIGLVPKEPQPREVPYLWHYDAIRPTLMEAGKLITAKEAERRVLVLENPGLEGESRITTSMYAGLQLIFPGEIAASHRHASAALRFIIEGSGAYTSVEGERTLMTEGDFVTTPSWTWHDHGNESERPMVWLDGLDMHIVNLLNASFLEMHPDEVRPLERPDGDSLARYGQGLMPDNYARKGGQASPLFSYPYARTRDALETMRKAEEWDPCHGLKLRYVSPVDGDYAMPTIGTFMQLLPKGFHGMPYRSTDGTVFACVEGRGRTRVGDALLEWGPRDVFVVPSWRAYRHEADADSVLFSFSDRPVQEKLGLWREQRGNDGQSGA
ncbi:MAG TPA: gentisate 1,2-dioxygenase [Alphaproteobacteria bacterium]|nr:gentisate 1,2-dioxygenase [Alphaproteobacteria bacterium]